MIHSLRLLFLSAIVLLAGAATAQADTATVHVVRKGCDAVLTMERLRTLPVHEATITERDGNTATFQGVWLSDALDLGCDSTVHLDKHGTLRAVVKVTAADGFTAVVAMAEVADAFSARPVLLAWARNGQPLGERHGPLRLVVPGDIKPGRNVRQVKRLEVITP
ncbi:MAG: molybdopterin-dependent oxidoreductase [Flavobacteriales bacterium]|jgi:DMSO/TMAO reductase YedYZ molybdopterin-dependent catalytic subunit|nr:molybdopterin-dependent oxidoreductase [Flavobacteriales bacterium]